MDKNKIKSMIYNTFIEVISDLVVDEIEKRIKFNNNKILVVFSGGIYGFKDSIKSIKAIIEDGYDVKVVLSESADNVLGASNIKKILNIEEIYVDGKNKDITKFIDKSHILVLPSLTINSAAKIANCISDNYLTRAVSKFILTDKKIYASRNSCCPRNEERLYYSMNPNNSFYERKMIENMETIEKYGIKFTEAKELDTVFIKKEKANLENNQNTY
ncbi:MAG: flavoprotein, partial [Bacillota bacterium]|nr:flavoprotein [Bacillota bacterium]